jgi:hypothetical protein
MGNTCSQCSKNKEGDLELGSNLSSYCDHGSHSLTTPACPDFFPKMNSSVEDLISSVSPDTEPMHRFMDSIGAHPRKSKPKHNGGVLDITVLPIISYVVVMAVILIIGGLAFVKVDAQSMTSMVSTATSIAPILILIVLLFAIANIAKPTS